MSSKMIAALCLILSFTAGCQTIVVARADLNVPRNQYFTKHSGEPKPATVEASELKGLVLANEPSSRAVDIGGDEVNYALVVGVNRSKERFFLVGALGEATMAKSGSRYTRKRQEREDQVVVGGNRNKEQFLLAGALGEATMAKSGSRYTRKRQEREDKVVVASNRNSFSSGNLSRINLSRAVRVSEIGMKDLIAFVESLDDFSEVNPRVGRFMTYASGTGLTVNCSRMPVNWECVMVVARPNLQTSVFYLLEPEQRQSLVNLIKLGLKQELPVP